MIVVTTEMTDWPTDEFIQQIGEDGCKAVSEDIFKAAVKLSPVYTGSFRASWRIAFNGAREEVTQGGTPEAPIRGASFRWPTGFKLGDTIVISNNLPYADLIEYGGLSNQAPFGVLGLAVASVRF